MLRHHHISINAERKAAALERALKDSSAGVGRKEGTAVITTEGYEMALPGVVITRETPRHEPSVRPRTSPLKAKEALNGPPVSEWNWKWRSKLSTLDKTRVEWAPRHHVPSL